MQIRCLVLVVSIAITSCAHVGERGTGEEGPAPAAMKVGDLVTDFEAEDIDGRTFRLSDFLSIGPRTPAVPRAVLVSFFATWCRPCRAELPELIRYQLANEQDVQVLLIVIPPVDMKTRQKLWRYLDHEKTKVMTLFDQAENIWTRFLGQDKSGIPLCIHIGKDGRVAARLLGYRRGVTIEERLQASEQPPPVPPGRR